MAQLPKVGLGFAAARRGWRRFVAPVGSSARDAVGRAALPKSELAEVSLSSGKRPILPDRKTGSVLLASRFVADGPRRAAVGSGRRPASSGMSIWTARRAPRAAVSNCLAILKSSARIRPAKTAAKRQQSAGTAVRHEGEGKMDRFPDRSGRRERCACARGTIFGARRRRACIHGRALGSARGRRSERSAAGLP